MPKPDEQAALRAATAALKSTVKGPQADLEAVLERISPEQQQAQAEAVLKPLVERIQGGESYEAIEDELSDLYPELDVSAIEDMLTRLFFVAETWGRLNA